MARKKKIDPFVEKLAQQLDMEPEQAADLYEHFIELLAENLANHQTVTIKNFGNFEAKETEVRRLYNIKTGDYREIPSDLVLKFRSSTRVKELLKS